MSNQRLILCGNPADMGAVDNRSTRQAVRLRLWGSEHEVTLRVGQIEDQRAMHVPDRFLDLLELATYVYCADQAVTRGGPGVDNAGADWRRTLDLRVAV